MNSYLIKKSVLKGEIVIPPSKSHSMRAILFASLAKGKSTLFHVLDSPDIEAMIRACISLGAKIKKEKDLLEIQGVAGSPSTPEDVIDAGNSGQVLRFVGAVASLCSGYTIITGDESIRKRRSIAPLCEGLNQLGCFCISTENNGYAPLVIKGPLCHGVATIDGRDSQPISALLIASSFVEGKTEIRVKNPGEQPWVYLTLDWLKKRGISYTNENFERFTVIGKKVCDPFTYTVPGDFSSAAFPLAAALVTNSELTLSNLDMEDVQGDKELISTCVKMGANIEMDRERKKVHVKKGGRLIGQRIDVNSMIDAIPVLAVLGCFAKGKTILANASIARQKESDRLQSITHELKKMGAKIIEQDDSLVIYQSELKGATLFSHFDHRIAMALTIASFKAKGESVVERIDCVKKSYPNFAEELCKIGCKVEEI